jgi:3-oxoacyl-[acyl-carrier protein] reductase
VKGKRVLVTGASRGIGRAIALRLGADGWSVAVHYNKDRDAAFSVVDLLGVQAGGLYRSDLGADSEAAGNLVDSVAADGALDAVVNNAGVYLPFGFGAATSESFEHNLETTMALNFLAPIRIIRAALTPFESAGGGKVLNVASRVGFKSEAGAAIYAASKAALINVTRSLAVELAPRKVTLFGIAPGWVDTAMAREGMEERLPSILDSIPLGRMASPEDCAAVASFLLSDEASYLSGQVVDINGASYFH